jgi:hypothetical protein
MGLPLGGFIEYCNINYFKKQTPALAFLEQIRFSLRTAKNSKK